MTGGNKSLAGPLFRAMIRACQLDGRIYTATAIDTGAIAGLALWFPPGKFLWQKSVANIAGYIISLIVRSDAQRNLGFNQFLESLSLKTREWWINTVSSADSYWFLPLISLSKYGPALAPFIKTALSPHVRPILLLKIFLTKFQTAESSWYLSCICVDPKYQRQGIATNMIKMVEEKVWCSVRYDICRTSSHLQAMTTSILALCTDTDDNVCV